MRSRIDKRERGTEVEGGASAESEERNGDSSYNLLRWTAGESLTPGRLLYLK